MRWGLIAYRVAVIAVLAVMAFNMTFLVIQTFQSDDYAGGELGHYLALAFMVAIAVGIIALAIRAGAVLVSELRHGD